MQFRVSNRSRSALGRIGVLAGMFTLAFTCPALAPPPWKPYGAPWWLLYFLVNFGWARLEPRWNRWQAGRLQRAGWQLPQNPFMRGTMEAVWPAQHYCYLHGPGELYRSPPALAEFRPTQLCAAAYYLAAARTGEDMATYMRLGPGEGASPWAPEECRVYRANVEEAGLELAQVLRMEREQVEGLLVLEALERAGDVGA